MRAIRLKTEYLFDPIGINVRRPRLMWNCEDGMQQTAYEIEARTENGEELWISGKVRSSSMHADWGGADVDWKTRVLWRVRVYDERSVASEWSEASFETGLPEDSPWAANWITGDYVPGKKERYPADCFRKRFRSGKVSKARLYATACGLYEVRLNGTKAGRQYMAPGITDYRKKIQYQTIDVTELIREGQNEITVELADGWYRGSVGAWGLRNQYGTETKFICVLELSDETGDVQTVATDGSWDWSNDGPVRFADNKDGESVNANYLPSYTGKAKVTSFGVIPTASNNVIPTEQESFAASLIVTPSGAKVLDFGQNIAGYVSFRLYAREGEKIRMRFGEMLDEKGEFTQENIQCRNKKITTPLQEVNYICKDGENDYRTRFAVFGFRYVLVESDIPVCAGDYTAHAVYSDMERTGYFSSSNELLNRFFESTVWSMKGNCLDLPTDCPTRERHGWTGDAQIFCSTASYLFDYASFGGKFIHDMYTWQRKNGCLPHIVPDGGADADMNPMNGSVGWADAGVIMPYVLWKRYGDDRILKKYLDGMRKYAAFMQRRCGRWYPTAKRTGLKGEEKKYLYNAGQSYGEWAEPQDVHAMSWLDCTVTHPESGTAYTVLVMDLMSEIEMALGNEKESREYADFAAKARKSYQALRKKNREYGLDTDRQALLVRPLAFGLLDGEQTRYARARLIRALENYGWRIGTGFLSTPLILDVLTDIDPEYAYRLLENEDCPGWLFMPKNGATTIWEAWEGNATGNRGIASLNHYSKGAVCSWLFETMCGIHVTGENRFRIRPVPGGHFTSASACYNSVYGVIRSSWEKEGDRYSFTVSVPCNCTAEVVLPDGTVCEQAAGEKRYTV